MRHPICLRPPDDTCGYTDRWIFMGWKPGHGNGCMSTLALMAGWIDGSLDMDMDVAVRVHWDLWLNGYMGWKPGYGYDCMETLNHMVCWIQEMNWNLKYGYME